MEKVSLLKISNRLSIYPCRYYYLQYLKLVYNKYKAAYLRWEIYLNLMIVHLQRSKS